MNDKTGYDGMELSTQLIIAEAERRAINVEILDRSDNFIRINKGKKTEYLKQATRTAADTYIAPLIMENKLVTKKVLAENGIPTPAGEQYFDIASAIREHDRYTNREIVVKPNSTNFGKGITILKIPRSITGYHDAVQKAFDYDESILVEEFIEGKEYRFLVVGDKPIAVLHRVPANVVGDGIHSIEELVHIKNKDPLRGRGYKTPLEKLALGEDERSYLGFQGRRIEDIPIKDERVFLRKNSNISTGGDSIDYTDQVLDEYKSIAVKASKAVGASICGADVIIRDIRAVPDETNYSIIELNFNPALHIHSFPFRGKNRHPEQAVLNLLGF